MRALGWRRVLAAAIAVAGLAVLAAFVVVRHIENDAPAPSDEVFDIVAPRGDEIRRTRVLELEFQTGTCSPGDEEDRARQINAPLRVEIQDRPEAVVIKARIDHDYVRATSPSSDPEAICAGVGLSFTRRILLPTPIGKRALLNGGFYHRGLAPMLLRPSLVQGQNRLWSSRIKRLRYMGINRDGHRLRPGETP